MKQCHKTIVYFILFLFTFGCGSQKSTLDEKKNDGTTDTSAQSSSSPSSASSPVDASPSETKVQGQHLIQNALWFTSDQNLKSFFERNKKDEQKLEFSEKINIKKLTSENNLSTYFILVDFSDKKPETMDSVSLVLGDEIEGERIISLEWFIESEPGMTPIPADYSQENQSWILRLGGSALFKNILNRKKDLPFLLFLQIKTATQIYMIQLNLELYQPIQNFEIKNEASKIELSHQQLATGQFPKNGIEVFKTKIKNTNNNNLYFEIKYTTPLVLKNIIREVRHKAHPHQAPQLLDDAFYFHKTPFQITHYQVVRYSSKNPLIEPLKPFLGDKNPLFEIGANETIDIKWFFSYKDNLSLCRLYPITPFKYQWIEQRRPHYCRPGSDEKPPDLIRRERLYSTEEKYKTLHTDQCYDGPIDPALNVTHEQIIEKGFEFVSAFFLMKQNSVSQRLNIYRSLQTNHISKFETHLLNIENGSLHFTQDFPNQIELTTCKGRFVP